MASTTVEVQLPSLLSSPTLSLYAAGSDTLANSGGADALTEATNAKGFYTATVTEALDGIYAVKVLVGSNVVYTGWVTLQDDASIYRVVDNYADASDLTAAAVADAVWDEAASGHNTGGSFGKFLRQLKEGVVSVEADVDDVSATTTSFVTTLTETDDSHYHDLTVAFIGGNLTGQSRVATSYNGTTKTLTFDEAWSEAPADGDTFIILTPHVHAIDQIADGVWDEPTAGHTTAGTFGEQVKTDIDSILSLLGSLNDVTASGVATEVWNRVRSGSEASGSFGYFLDALVSGAGGESASNIADAVWDEAKAGHTTPGTYGYYLDDQISTIDVEGGEGAYTFTVTVDDGTSVLQNATVRFTEGVNSLTATTNTSGVATLNLDAANYNVAITKAGYGFTGTTQNVTANGSATYSMTKINPTLSDPDLSTGYLTAYNQSGVAESGVEVAVQFLGTPFEDRGKSYDNDPIENLTNAIGYVEFTGLFQGAEYRVRRGKGSWDKFRVPTSGIFQLDSVIGND